MRTKKYVIQKNNLLENTVKRTQDQLNITTKSVNILKTISDRKDQRLGNEIKFVKETYGKAVKGD